MRPADALLSVVFPDACVACGQLLDGHGFFCPSCELGAQELSADGCPRCGEPGPRHGAGCPRCVASPPPFRAAYAAYLHDGAVARAVHRFKYEQQSDLARPLAALLAWRGKATLERWPGALVPVPLHDERFRERGYDQATLLAVALGRAVDRPVWDTALTRTRSTQRQVGLGTEAREENLRGAFVADRRVRGQAVVLVDDVFTTGATARHAALALLEAGALEVRVVTLARAAVEAEAGG